MSQLTLFAAERHASPSQSQDSERDWTILVATSRSPILRFLSDSAPAGWSGRTSPAYCQIAQGLLAPSSEGWGNSGMGSPTEFLTLNTAEFHSGAVACSLSDVLETGELPQRFFLSATACKGILRRADLLRLIADASEDRPVSALTLEKSVRCDIATINKNLMHLRQIGAVNFTKHSFAFVYWPLA